MYQIYKIFLSTYSIVYTLVENYYNLLCLHFTNGSVIFVSINKFILNGTTNKTQFQL